MATYLLTWNPQRWNWADLAEDVAAVRVRAEKDFRWSTGNTRRIVPGDRLFMLKQGEGLRGIFGAGRATSNVFEDAHHDEERERAGDQMLYVNVRFDELLNPFTEDILPLEELEARVRGVHWTPPASGFSVPDDAAETIEKLWRNHIERIRPSPFLVGQSYTKRDIYRAMNVPRERQRGDWDTGYHFHDGTWFLFPTIGGAGRTGHDYGNHWNGDDLVWFGDTESTLRQPTMRSLLSGKFPVNVFTRTDSRHPFTYEGLGSVKGFSDESPVRVVWEFNSGVAAILIPEEVQDAGLYREGATKQITVNCYERHRGARRACIAAHGAKCAACSFDFSKRYGTLGSGYIQVHHLELISSRGAEYVLNPIRDLIPVCPNCHAMLHQRTPPLSIEELKACLRG